MDNEVRLTGGRMTAEVVRKGDLVYRSMCANAPFVHEVLIFLEKNNINCAPVFRGIDGQNREMLRFIHGAAPENLGFFTTKQCCQAAALLRTLHDSLRLFPGCPSACTVCHNDLSPCNFLFSNDFPIAVIDWDAAAFGNPLDDLAYAAWMWLDIGNGDYSFDFVEIRMNAMLDAYGVSQEARSDFADRMMKQMTRVGAGAFPTEEQTLAAQAWVFGCQDWLRNFMKRYK